MQLGHALDLDAVRERVVGPDADHDAPGDSLALEAGREVDGVADDAVPAVAALCSDHSGGDLAAVHAGAEPRPVGMAARDLRRLALERQRGPARAQGMVGLAAVLVEDDHDRVADQLVDLAAEPLHQRDEPAEVRIQHLAHDGRRRPLGEGRVAL